MRNALAAATGPRRGPSILSLHLGVSSIKTSYKPLARGSLSAMAEGPQGLPGREVGQDAGPGAPPHTCPPRRPAEHTCPQQPEVRSKQRFLEGPLALAC